MLIELEYFSLVALTIFIIGVSGIVVNRKNIITILMSVELMLLSINFYFVISSISLEDIFGQIFSIYVLTVAAAESAIGLAILVIHHRLCGTIAVEFMNKIKG